MASSSTNRRWTANLHNLDSIVTQYGYLQPVHGPTVGLPVSHQSAGKQLACCFRLRVPRTAIGPGAWPPPEATNDSAGLFGACASVGVYVLLDSMSEQLQRFLPLLWMACQGLLKPPRRRGRRFWGNHRGCVAGRETLGVILPTCHRLSHQQFPGVQPDYALTSF